MANSSSNPTNSKKDGNDAHEAELISTFQDTLTDSSYRELRAFTVSVFRDEGKKNTTTSEWNVIQCFSVITETIELWGQPKWLMRKLNS